MSTSSANTMTTAALQPLLRLLENKGFSGKDLLASIGMDLPTACSATQRISIPKFDQILEHTSRMLEEPAIGLSAGQRLELPSFYLLGFLISSCQTGREALAVLRRYYALISDSRTPDFFIGHDTIKIVFYTADGTQFGNQARAEFVASGIHTAGQAIGGHYYQIQNIGFKHSPPAYRDRLQKYFNVPIQYNQTHNWITLSARYIDSPLNYANPLLFSNLKSDIHEALQKLNFLQQFSRKVMYILYQWPETVPITKDCVAELLSTSSRTLTRRLQEEDCQFSHLVREVRLSKAKSALTTAKTDVQQLALNLGFSDRRGFERAFKHWTGITPAAYRKKNTELAANYQHLSSTNNKPTRRSSQRAQPKSFGLFTVRLKSRVQSNQNFRGKFVLMKSGKKYEYFNVLRGTV